MSNEEIAYRLIRIKARELVHVIGNSDGRMTNEQLGCYIRGIVDLQTELYEEQLKEQNTDYCEDI